MKRHVQLALAGIAATLLLGLAANPTFAGKLSLTARSFRIGWQRLEFTDETSTVRATCPVTLEGSFSSATIRKTVGAVLGYATRQVTSRCSLGEGELEMGGVVWRIQYVGFTGTLPRISGLTVKIVEFYYRFKAFNEEWCNYFETGAEQPKGTFQIEASARITGFVLDTTVFLPRAGLNFFCPARSAQRGTATVSTGTGGELGLYLI